METLLNFCGLFGAVNIRVVRYRPIVSLFITAVLQRMGILIVGRREERGGGGGKGGERERWGEREMGRERQREGKAGS